MSGMPSLSVSDGQPAHELRQVIIAASLRPQHKMPVIWHQAMRQQSHGHTVECLSADTFNGRIVAIVPADLLSTDGAIQNMVNVSTSTNSFPSRHQIIVRRGAGGSATVLILVNSVFKNILNSFLLLGCFICDARQTAWIF